MIQSATVSRSPAPPERTADTRRGTGAGSFQQSLAAFLDAGTDEPEPAVPTGAGNDDPAADGKPLPDQPSPPPLAWLAQLPPVAPGPLPVAETPAPPPPVAAPALVPAAAPTLVAPMLELVPATPKDAPATDVVETSDAPVADAPLPETKVDTFALPAVPDPAPRGAAPAAEVFGAAIRAAVGKDDDATPRRDVADAGPPSIGAVGLEPQRHAVLATGDVQQAPLDTRQGDFAHQMIDRIEQLRDDANANDTRIRLIPDALGRIDVTMRRDGDAVHVHFAAEQAATRAMLADAQPQLADIAASRGLTLGQTSVGSDGGAQQRPQTPPPIPTWQPQRAATPATAAATSDIRIA
ncbi:flagellar hook-length control protein FliK [Sphingomonas ginsenosidivorax]|uniref:Flagellar hook-length control protein FliK n=1 Tax=Sphingomonas ginsenosidivorax TaxID=862135 RepID=A0A5C6UM13_9SPHN|nr:flagellar hook-length control protein FliK [Sphingomonas ginsenosidivorax]TXC72435.1 flagellar hook-length control protein FliK [Sphingomonas ginsenosidivorax]